MTTAYPSHSMKREWLGSGKISKTRTISLGYLVLGTNKIPFADWV